MYCDKCGRWIDSHEEEARQHGFCRDGDKCEARAADPNYPDYHSAAIAIRTH
jgi:hypothetical protein